MQAIRVLPFMFLFTGSITLFDQFVSKRLNNFSTIRESFVSSLQDTRNHLVVDTWRASEDLVIQQNLAWNNLNSVGQLLQNYMPSGEVTQLTLLDVDCNLLGRVPNNSKPLATDCKQLSTKNPAMTWLKNDSGLPVLTLSLPRVIGGRPVIFVSQVVLGAEWLSLYPKLGAFAQRHEIAMFDDSRRGLLWSEANDTSGDPFVAVRIDGWLYRMLPDLTRYSLEPIKNPFWLCYGALGILIVMSIMQLSVQKRRDHLARESLSLWLESQKPTPNKSDSEPKNKLLSWEALTEKLKSLLAKSNDQRHQQVKLLRERQEQITLDQHDRERQIATLQEKLTSMADLASLKEQLQHSTGSVLKQMSQMRELCEDIYDVSTNGLTKQCKDLHGFYTHWKEGIDDQSHRERGARKFFRTLSETPGIKPNTTQLDEELTKLGNLSSAALDQSIHVAMLARQALTDSEGVAQVAGLWHGLASQSNLENITSDWISAMNLSQQMLTGDEKYKNLSFERLPKLDSPEETYPAKAKGALVSGFFHLFLSLLSSGDHRSLSAPIIVRQKRFSDQGTIILSLPQIPSDIASPTVNRDQTYHMELARAILAPLGIRTAFLPPTAAGVPVALTWPLPGKEVEVAVSPSAQTNNECEL